MFLGSLPSCKLSLAPASARTNCFNLRSDGGMLLEDYSARLKKTLRDGAFKTAAPKIWNILPEDIRMQDNYNIFKGQLKTHYFRLAYNF